MNSGTSPIRHAHRAGRVWSCLLALVLVALAAGSARGDTQFDVFLGYGDLGGGGLVPEATWFPAVCEIKNDGPTFTGYIEISAGNYGESQKRRVAVELPTGTRKRISIPLFASGRYQSVWDFRLVDERGRLRAERSGLGARAMLAAGTVLMGALPRSSPGTPVIRQTQSRPADLQPTVARFVESAILPDNPLVWEGMDAFYLNSEKAPEMTTDQAEALLAWVNNGGRLIVAVDAVGDVNGTPWLRSLLPVELNGTRTVAEHHSIQDWLKSTPPASSLGSARTRVINGNNIFNGNPFAALADDSDFERTELVVATGTVRKGSVLASSGDMPLIVTAREGRGMVTVLLFDPERDPSRSWKNLPTLWARLAGVPAEFYANENTYQRSSQSIDGVFGAMVDSKQIRKLPVEWLLLLLIVYLAVIGPLDQYWLKRIKRPMLTWLTFPCYVVIFSMMIYLIGYKLRAGETEWNELHLVDVLPRGEAVEMRGRSYFSIYSPVNETYHVESQQAFSAFRGESMGSYGTTDDERAEVSQDGENYKASIYVPVWTSQLYASDWWEPADQPLRVKLVPNNQGWTVTIDNPQLQPLATVRMAIGGTLYDLGEVPAGQSVTNQINRGSGRQVLEFVQNNSRNFQNASAQRRHTFGNTAFAQLDNLCDCTMAISLLGVNYPENAMNQNSFVMPPGMDLSPDLDQGEALLLAWEPGVAPTKPVNQFPTRRSHKDTLWRVTVPLNQSSTP